MWERMNIGEKVAAVLLGVLVLGGCCHWVLSPQLTIYQGTKTSLVHDRRALLTARTDAALLAAETNRLKSARAAMAGADDLFNQEMRDGSALFIMGMKASECGVKITGAEPGKVKIHAHSLEMPVNIFAGGEYQNILSFCQALETDTPNDTTAIVYMKIEKNIVSGNPAASAAPSLPAVPVKAELDIVISSAIRPASGQWLEDASGWGCGRADIFQPDGISAMEPGTADPG